MASTSTVANTTRLSPSGWVLLSCSRSSTFCDELLAACGFHQLQKCQIFKPHVNTYLTAKINSISGIITVNEKEHEKGIILKETKQYI
jgi:hypothetical protein